MKVLMITADGYDDSEVLYPYYRLIEEGFEVEIASFEKTIVLGKYHFKIEANKVFNEVNVNDYTGLVIPGGTAPEKIRLDEAALSVVKKFMTKNMPVASICHGQQILISAGMLEGRRVTCYKGIKDDIINSKAVYKDMDVVVDNNLVTSRRPDDLPYFMREFIKLI